MENEHPLAETLDLLWTHFPAFPGNSASLVTAGVTLEQVRQYLVEQISLLVDRNPALLMSILYRIDVAEKEVLRVLTTSPTDSVPAELAELVLMRQLQKQQIRQAYKNRNL